MFDPAVQEAIRAIHAVGHPLVFEFAGAGSLALAALHSEGGSSRTILEATDRYCAASRGELLGALPEKCVEPHVAAAMADRAYIRACQLGEDSKSKLGVACTATIATDRAKRGEHRCCVAVQNEKGVTTFDLILTKGSRTRHEEEELIAKLIIGAVAQAVGISPPAPDLLPGEQVVGQTLARPDPLQSLWAGAARWVTIELDGTRCSESPAQALIYCGSFNPLHFGHEALAAAAQRITGLPLVFELASVNAEKAPLDRSTLERRISQFWQRYRVVVTRSPLFAEKAALFPGSTFVVGYDTAERLVDPRFYGNSESGRDQALAAIVAAGCRVLVAGRLAGESFKSLRDLSIPAGASELFIELPPSEFRADVSATVLRALRAGK